MSAFGFLVSGITGGRAVPDRGFTRSSKPAVLHVKFGDGYEQRASDGINSVKEEYNFNFTNRNKADIDLISDFLDTNKGVTAFEINIPDEDNTSGSGFVTIKGVCDDYTTTFGTDDFWNLSMKIRRVFEP
tara:strand:+ start:466 stop:855 length:390 start_codon:yes stop_codon:yes gene_type:complete